MVYSAAEEAAHKEERYHRLYMDIAYGMERYANWNDKQL